MKIERIEAVPFRIPYTHPISFATGRLEAAEHVLIQVHTAEGAIGTAEAIPRPMVYGETVASVLGAIESIVKPLLLGKDLHQGFALRRTLAHLAGNNTLRGALDIALWDAAGRLADLPCWRLMGGEGGTIAVTAVLGLGTPAEVVEEATKLHQEYGIASFKVKVGMEPVREVEVCRAVRDAFPDALLYVDANHGFSPEQALWFLDKATPLDLAWIEEPVDASGSVTRALVASRTPRPILSDESAPDLGSAARELLAGHSHMVSVKVARTGLTQSAQILALCEALGCEVVVGSQGDSGIGTLASLQFAGLNEVSRRHPGELSFFLTALADDVLQEPLNVRDGLMQVPDGPGLGGNVDHEKVAHYAV